MRIRQAVWTGVMALVGAGWLTSPAGAVAVSVRVLPATLTVAPLDTFTVQIAVDAADSVFNAFDAYLAFDSSKVAFVPAPSITNQVGALMSTACGSAFHIFTPHPTQLDVSYSLLCNLVFLNGPGVIYQVKFRVKPVLPTSTTLSLMPATTFYKAGFAMLPLGIANMTLTIPDVTGVGELPRRGPSIESPVPNPTLRGTRAALAFTLAEAGIIHLDIHDVSGRRVGGMAARSYPAGRNVIQLPTQGLAPGTYWTRLSDARGRESARTWVIVK